MARKYLSDATGKNGLKAILKGNRPHKHRKMLYVAFRSLQNASQILEARPLQIERMKDTPELVSACVTQSGVSLRV